MFHRPKKSFTNQIHLGDKQNARNLHLSVYRQFACPKIIRNVHMWGQKHQTTIGKTTTQQLQLQMFVFHVCQQPYLSSFAN